MTTQIPNGIKTTYSSTEARTHWRDIMNASDKGLPVSIGRHGATVSAVTDAERLRKYLSQTLDPHTLTFFEDGLHAIVLEQLGFASEGASLEAAIEDMIVQLREYADDWGTHFSAAPNHADNWALVQLISLSSEAHLREWLISGGN